MKGFVAEMMELLKHKQFKDQLKQRVDHERLMQRQYDAPKKDDIIDYHTNAEERLKLALHALRIIGWVHLGWNGEGLQRAQTVAKAAYQELIKTEDKNG